MIPVDKYIRENLGWADIEQYLQDEDGIGPYPARTFADGPYLKLEDGCYWRLPAEGSDE
jgi:hypothetical protein